MIFSEEKKLYYHQKGLEAVEKIENFLTKSKNIYLFWFMFTVLYFLLLSIKTAHAQIPDFNFGDTSGDAGASLNEAAGSFVTGLKCFLQGNGGWGVIGIGVLLAAFDYFFQRQGYLLAAAAVAIFMVIVLRKVLPGQCQ